MQIDIVNIEGKKVGSADLADAVFGAKVKDYLLWELVKAQQAAKRAGTHATKTRAHVRGGGKKPYKQKGTGRAQAGSTRSPLWRHGGTVFPPQPRSYDYDIPKKVERGALKAALMAKLQDKAIVVVDELKAAEKKTKATAALLKRLGATSRTLVVDARLDDNFLVSARNIAGVTVVASGRLTARDVMNTTRIIATRAAIERLQEVLG